MSSIRLLVQSALDTALYALGVKAHWKRKSGGEADEYIVYRLNGDPGEVFADNEALTKSADLTISYYYRSNKTETEAGRLAVEARITLIAATLVAAGFECPEGPADVGDVDDIGYDVAVFGCAYTRTV